jgi:hypothetical protein
MVSDRYAVVQHSEAFGSIIPVLEKLQIKTVSAAVQFTTDTAYLYVSLPEKFNYVAPDGVAINLGFVGINSHNSSHAAEWSGFGMRQTCSNGMVAKKLLGHIRSVHVGQAVDRLTDWAMNYQSQIADLDTQIKLAMTIGVSREEAEIYFRTVSKDSKRFVSQAMALWDTTYAEQKNMWGLLNTATDMYSHKSTSLKGIYEGLESTEVLLTAPAQAHEEISGALKLQFQERDRAAELYTAQKEVRRAAREFEAEQNRIAEREKKAAEKAASKKPSSKSGSMPTEALADIAQEIEEVDFAKAEPLPPAKPDTLETPDSEFSRVVSLADLAKEDETVKDEEPKRKGKKSKKEKK